MHYDLLSDRDLELLDSMRLEHFRASYPELADSSLFLSSDRTLVISGGDLKISDGISSLIIRDSYFLTCASAVMVYANGELIINSDCNILEIYSNGDPMVVAAEKAEILAPTEEREHLNNQIIKSLALSDIAADLDAPSSDIHSFLIEQNAILIDFQGTIIVPESEATKAYEHYSLIRARQKMLSRFATNSTIKPASTQPLATKNTPKESSKPKKPTLTFKREFKANKSNYKKTVENFLNAMFPDSPSDQQQALSDIATPNEMGGAYLDKIVKAADYKDKQHSRDLLYKAAAELQKGDAPKKEDSLETAV